MPLEGLGHNSCGRTCLGILSCLIQNSQHMDMNGVCNIHLLNLLEMLKLVHLLVQMHLFQLHLSVQLHLFQLHFFVQLRLLQLHLLVLVYLSVPIVLCLHLLIRMDMPQ